VKNLIYLTILKIRHIMKNLFFNYLIKKIVKLKIMKR